MRKKLSILLVVFLLMLTSILLSCIGKDSVNLGKPSIQEKANDLKVHFIDVGQGDSTFIQLADGKTILIDGGNKADSSVIIDYLKALNIKSIDYLIATHPHEDHIGSLPAIIKYFNIRNIYMPKITHNTKIFEDLLLSIKAKGYKINTAAAGVKIIDSKDMKVTVLAPNSEEYKDLNNYSVVVKLTYKETSFLFTGDAEDVSEIEMLKQNVDLKSDVIKVGHHGGRTSSTKDFLEAVAPKYAIVSVGLDNDYGHPHKETIDRLQALNSKIFRTDQQGTIVARSDGKTITIDKQAIVLENNDIEASKIYIGNKNSKVFHISTCSGLPNLENQIKLSSKTEAENGGYKPCQICKP